MARKKKTEIATTKTISPSPSPALDDLTVARLGKMARLAPETIFSPAGHCMTATIIFTTSGKRYTLSVSMADWNNRRNEAINDALAGLLPFPLDAPIRLA